MIFHKLFCETLKEALGTILVLILLVTSAVAQCNVNRPISGYFKFQNLCNLRYLKTAGSNRLTILPGDFHDATATFQMSVHSGAGTPFITIKKENRFIHRPNSDSMEPFTTDNTELVQVCSDDRLFVYSLGSSEDRISLESQAGPSRFMNPRATGPRFESQEQSFWSLYDYLLRIQVFPFGQIGITFLPPAPSPPGQPSRGPDSSCSGPSCTFYLSHDGFSQITVSPTQTSARFDISQFELYRGFHENGTYVTGEAVTIRIANTQNYLYAQYDTLSGRIVMNERERLSTSTSQRRFRPIGGTLEDLFRNISSIIPKYPGQTAQKPRTRPALRTPHAPQTPQTPPRTPQAGNIYGRRRRSSSWTQTPTSQTISLQTARTMDFTHKTSKLPVPLQCQTPVCHYGYYCQYRSQVPSALCQDRYLADERVFVVERLGGGSVRLQHVLDKDAYLAVLSLNGQLKLILTRLNQSVPAGALNFDFNLPVNPIPAGRFHGPPAQPPPGCSPN